MSKSDKTCLCLPGSACACPPDLPKEKYGEEETLEAMQKFQKFYEDKLKQIDIDGGGDCTELKLKLQERWIKDLTEQTEMMARIVKELEEEATTRVRMLEDKLKQTSKAAYEVMKRYQTYNITHNLDEPFQKVYYLENDLKNVLEFIRRVRDDGKWSIEGLQFYDVTYDDLFGRSGKEQLNDESDESHKYTSLVSFCNGMDSSEKETAPTADSEVPNYEELLKKKDEEYEALRQSMLDMRSALTEEVACKHDMILTLKKDVLQLEERCLQADKQTAFKDDIIKELRKEIKQLKQQLKKENEEKKSEEVETLQRKLKEAEAKIRRMRPCVDTKTVCTVMDDIMADKEKELEDEICCRQREVEELKDKCQELEKALCSSQARGENLQKAVDLYLNSINVLEASEERSRLEIEQQRITINNLQDALVGVKHELDEFRQKNQQEVHNQHYIINVLYVNLLDLEGRNESLNSENSRLVDCYKKLQDYSFELEVEHFNSLQDIALLETQLHKYQTQLRAFEEEQCAARNEVKKLRRQKRCYEHVLECFKHEMAVMSEQLVNLQEILKLSNESCKEENSQLCNALVDLQQVSQRLKVELKEAERKILIENQMNQLKDAKIDELQLIIGQKNADLTVHDEAIHEMKRRLENTIIENHELQATIVALNSTVMQLQCADYSQIKKERSKSRTVVEKKSVDDLQAEVEKKDRKLNKLQKDYVAQYEILKTLQTEFDKVKEKNREKVKALKRQNDSLKEKLEKAEDNNQKMVAELTQLKEQTALVAQKDSNREQELVQSKQIIIELRQTLIELNENLAESELQQMALVEECHKRIKDERQQEDIYLSCQCEIVLYKKLVQNLKETLLKMKRNLAEVETQNKSLHEELKHKDMKIVEIQKKLARKEKESCQNVKELTEKLRQSHEEERRLSDFIDKLKNQVQQKLKHNEIKESECRCEENRDEMAATQKEISSLKIEIKRMIQNQLALNNENDKLLKQVSCLQTSQATMEEKNRHLKQKIEKLQQDNQKLKENVKNLLREKEMFAQTIKNLEIEIAETRNNRDDICAESKHVVNNVKAWLEEQRRINDKVKKRTQCYCDAITKLRQENKNLQNKANTSPGSILKPSDKSKKPFRSYSPPPPQTNLDCPNPWCYDSQGNDSPRDSPSSFLTCSVEEWYSPNYRDETDFESDHENDFIHTLEAVAVEMKNSNIKWKDMYKECECTLVSKDDK